MYIITAEQLQLLCCVIYNFIYSSKDTYSGILRSVINVNWHAKRDSNHYYPNSFSILLDILILNSSIADGKVC